MVEKKKKKVVTYFNQMAWVSWGVGRATCVHHPVSAPLKAAYFRIRKQMFLVSIERNQNSLLMLNGLKEASKKTQ